MVSQTLSSTPSTRPQPLMTKGSLAATTAITSTPFVLNSSYFPRYGGRWFAWQVGWWGKAESKLVYQTGRYTHSESSWDGDDNDLFSLPFTGLQRRSCRAFRVVVNKYQELGFVSYGFHMQAVPVIRRLWFLMTAASTNLIRERRAPRNIGERPRRKSIANLRNGHGYLQKRWIQIYRLIVVYIIAASTPHGHRSLCIPCRVI